MTIPARAPHAVARVLKATAELEELQRRALVMRRVRVLVAGVVPLEMFMYVTPPGITSRLHPLSATVGVVAVLLGVTACSAAVHRRITDTDRLRTWAWAELAADNLLCLWILYLFSFDQFSAVWTILVIVSLEGAFRGGRRGALLAWSLSAIAYTGIQVLAAHSFPDTAPLDIGSIVFRAMVTGIVAMVAGQLASQLQEAVERHRASEVALAEQYADLQLIGRVSRAIAAGPAARAEVCQAVGELSGASTVMLFEPVDKHLQCSAAAGCDSSQIPRLSLDDPSAGTVRAFRTGNLQLVPEAELPSAFTRTRHLLEDAGMASAAFVPVTGPDGPIGAMCLTFAEHHDELPARVIAALAVLAEEAAVAITRADFTAQLSEQARRDPLTGLVNRRGMEESIGTEMRRARRTRAPLTVLMLDLDGLKVFNDTYGHEAGDRLITAAASGWLGRLRPTDVLARYGGDEFVALLPGCDEQLAMRVAEALLQSMPPGGACSVGLAEWNRTETMDSMLARADTALYASKRSGGGRVIRALPQATTAAACPIPAPRVIAVTRTPKAG